MNTLDSRDLQWELEALLAQDQEPDGLEHDETVRLIELEHLADEIGSEWAHGVQLIPHDEFTDYARELASDIGAISDTDGAWPHGFIDWERAADALKVDYIEVELDGKTYLARA